MVPLPGPILLGFGGLAGDAARLFVFLAARDCGFVVVSCVDDKFFYIVGCDSSLGF